MKQIFTFVAAVIVSIVATRADILVIGKNFDDIATVYTKQMLAPKVTFLHEDSCRTKIKADLVIFKSDCSDRAIAKIRLSLRETATAFAVESDTVRAGIEKLIPSQTAIANVMQTRLCDCSEKQVSYAVACCWYKAITGKDASECSFKPDGIRDEVIGVLQICGSEAAEHPGMVTEIDEHWYLPALDTQWKGKRVVFLGDSITDSGQLKSSNDTYWHMLEKMLGIEAFVYGISGHQMSHILGQAEKMEKDLGNGFDAIVIFAGTNDYNSSTPLGDWYTYRLEKVNDHGTDTVLMRRHHCKDITTFRGRINIVLDSLKSHFPGKQIVMLTPIHRSWANFGGNNIQPDESFCNREGTYIDYYVECIREASSIWSVSVIDLFAEAGIHPGVESHGKYFRHPENNIDLLHPNTSGHIFIAYTIAYKMTSIPCFPF